MARKSSNRPFLFLLSSLIIVVGIITAVSQAEVGSFFEEVTTPVRNAVSEASDTIRKTADRVSSRPLAEGIADYLKQPEILTMPADGDLEVLLREGFFLVYCDERRIPLWVGYELTDEETEGEHPRKSNFRGDPELGDDVPDPDTYTHSGYDRGHMIPAADVKWSEEAMAASFFMSNIAPQVPELNRGVWRELEEAIRDLARQEGAIIVVTGPVIADGKEYELLDAAETVIPEYFFKVVLDYSEPRVEAWGFIFPNSADDLENRSYGDFLVSVDKVEEFTGYDFFAPLPDDLEGYLEERTPALF